MLFKHKIIAAIRITPSRLFSTNNKARQIERELRENPEFFNAFPHLQGVPSDKRIKSN